MSRAGDRILRSVRQARAFARGEATEGFVVHVPETVDVKAIRAATGLSQEAFAHRYGFSLAAVRDWEQHRRQPEQAARVLLLVIAHAPNAVTEALAAAAPRRSARSVTLAPETGAATKPAQPLDASAKRATGRRDPARKPGGDKAASSAHKGTAAI